MNTFLDVALGCIARGWFVFPCKPRGKEPLIKGGFHAATTDIGMVKTWWQQWPVANVGIATGASGLTVLDIDTGLDAANPLWAVRDLCRSVGVGVETYTVRTGRRPGFGVQLYFQGGDLKSIPWSHGGVSGDIRSGSGYVLAAGSVHPSGAFYEALVEAPIAATPPFVRKLRSAVSERSLSGDEPIREHRNTALTSIAGKLRNAGLSAGALEAALIAVNAERCDPPMDESEVSRIAANAARWALPEIGVSVTLGKTGDAVAGPGAASTGPLDWRSRYHAKDELVNVPPGRFIVEGILYEGSITALAGYAGDRKSIISLNLAASCVTGKPFMDYYNVVNPPKRVLYLCPEMGLRELAERAKGLGFLDYVGDTMFVRTLDKEGHLDIAELTDGELDGALVILDTAIRFLKGSESDPQEMALFAQELFRLRQAGATVWVLFHASKASAGGDLNLQNALRGSSELAAMLSMCWATRLLEPDKRFDSQSRMYPVKVREFKALPFDFECDQATAAARIVGEPGSEVVLKTRKDDSAKAALIRILAASPDMGINKLRDALAEAGHRKGNKWVAAAKMEACGQGTQTASS